MHIIWKVCSYGKSSQVSTSLTKIRSSRAEGPTRLNFCFFFILVTRPPSRLVSWASSLQRRPSVLLPNSRNHPLDITSSVWLASVSPSDLISLSVRLWFDHSLILPQLSQVASQVVFSVLVDIRVCSALHPSLRHLVSGIFNLLTGCISIWPFYIVDWSTPLG